VKEHSELVAADCVNIRQGDIVDDDATPLGIAILSQTCDVVQRSKVRCLVAPVIEADEQSLREARKGRKPLHLYLEPGSALGPGSVLLPCIVDMEQARSVLKGDLAGKRLLARYVPEASSSHAGEVAARVGRAFNRFPFPDEVYPFFAKLRKHVQSKSGTPSPFGLVIDLVDDLRIRADQWTEPGRKLTLYVVVEQERLIPRDDYDPGWQWGNARVQGVSAGEELDALKLTRVCELILANDGGDSTSLANLWARFGECIVSELLHPSLNSEVVACLVEVLSDQEMTYRQYQRTVSLDLEVLSDSTVL
jgi:hypothetical protein